MRLVLVRVAEVRQPARGGAVGPPCTKEKGKRVVSWRALLSSDPVPAAFPWPPSADARGAGQSSQGEVACPTPWPVGPGACPGVSSGLPAAARAIGGGSSPAPLLVAGGHCLERLVLVKRAAGAGQPQPSARLRPATGSSNVVRGNSEAGGMRGRGVSSCPRLGGRRRWHLARQVRAPVEPAWAALSVPSPPARKRRYVLPIVSLAVSLGVVSVPARAGGRCRRKSRITSMFLEVA